MLRANNLSQISFAKLYKEQKELSDFKEKTAVEWDKKAQNFNDLSRHIDYINEFLKFVDFSGCETLLDFACGTGFLGLKAKEFVKEVTFCDFSEKMCELARLNNPNSIVMQGSFDDIVNFVPFDLVFASRCLGVSDLEYALKTLLKICKKRLYFTYKIDKSYINEIIINELDLDIVPTPNFIYAANILNELGYFFTINKISLKNNVRFNTFEELKNSVEFSYKKLNLHQENCLKDLFYSEIPLHKANSEWALFCVEKY